MRICISIIFIIALMLAFGCENWFVSEVYADVGGGEVVSQIGLGYSYGVGYGMGIGALGALSGAGIGFVVFIISRPCSECYDLNYGLILPMFGAAIGTGIGTLTGFAYGSAKGVYDAGGAYGSKRECLWPTYSTTIGGTIASSVAAGILIMVYDQWKTGLIALSTGTGLSPISATIAYHLSKTKQSNPTGMLHLESGKVQFTFPALRVKTIQLFNHISEADYTLQLVSVRF